MNKRGFTLIEVMIVVVIIGVLAAMAIPRFNVASHKAKEKEADMLLKATYQAQMTYQGRFSAPAASATDLGVIGFEPPPHLEFYAMPADADYALPMCMTSLGPWNNRGIDANGVIADC